MVKILISVVIYIISLVGGYAQSNNELDSKKEVENSYNIEVQINQVNSNQGKIFFALYDSQENFSKRNLLQSSNAQVVDHGVKVIFKNVKPGTYAITCFHDDNDNGKMDFEPSGMPKEDYGMTNNVMAFGPPQFSDGKFELKDKDLTFEIKL